MLQQAEWDQWKQSLATKALYNYLNKEIEELKSRFADGHFINADPIITLRWNVAAQAKTEVAKDIIALDYDDVMGVAE